MTTKPEPLDGSHIPKFDSRLTTVFYSKCIAIAKYHSSIRKSNSVICFTYEICLFALTKFVQAIGIHVRYFVKMVHPIEWN